MKKGKQMKEQRKVLGICAAALCGLSVFAEEGFTSLFNGRDLSGWRNATNAYMIADNVLYSKPQGQGYLFTNEEFTNFVFRFEFRLYKGSNNGIGLRCPLKGFASIDGMECQILDDTAPEYKDLPVLQRHAALYGITPAKQGAVKPVGEWNEEEIRMNGEKVTITINGKVVLDQDLSIQGKPMDPSRPRPGMHRKSGHLGLLAHKSRVDFRNLRVKRLP